MGYNFTYKIRTQAGASGGTAVTTWFKTFRVPGIYHTATRRHGIHQIPFRDGFYQPTVEEYFDAPVLLTDGFLKLTTSTSTGTGGHRHALSNYEGWWKAINDPRRDLWLGMVHPVHGNLERRVRPAGRPVILDAPWHIQTIFQAVDAFWREESPSTNNGSTFTVTGSAPVGDAQLLWTGTTGTVTHVATSDSITLTAAPTAAGILFDFGNRTVTKSSDGSAFTSFEVNAPHWFRFAPGENVLSPSGGVTVSVDYYPKHF